MTDHVCRHVLHSLLKLLIRMSVAQGWFQGNTNELIKLERYMESQS